MKPLICLAPLAGYTNVAYRNFMKKFGCDIVVSEMISDFALYYHNEETFKMLETTTQEKPVAIQLFGGSEESLINGLNILQEVANYDYLDLNLGCPVNKVTKNNAGSSWLKKDRQEELFKTVSHIVKVSKKPVTCKIRLGWNEEEITVVDTCKILQKAGVKMITIHGRTRSQLYSGNANYELIKKAKESVDIPIIANGDIDNIYKAKEVLEYTKCDGIALGRAVLGNPYLITQIKEYLSTETILPSPDINQQMDYLLEHYNALESLKGERVAIMKFRGIGSWYLKGFKGAKEFKVMFSLMKNKEDLLNIITQIKDNKLERI